MSLVRKAGTTDVSVVIRIVDSTDGTPETGVTSGTAGLDLEYRREGAVSTDITESDLTNLNDAHSDGGMKHIGNGYYRLDLPDAACAAGATGVLVHGTVTGMIVIGEYIQLVAYDPFDTVRLGLTALPNAAADAAGGLPISDAGGLDLDAQRSDVAAILVDTGTTLDGKINTIDGIVDDILLDTAEIGVAGAGLTEAGGTGDHLTALGTAAELAKVPKSDGTVSWNATALAAIQSEANDALVALGLDHLVSAAVVGTDVADNSIVAKLASKSATADWDSFVNTTDALEAIRDRGDAAWITATGFSTHSAADVWAVATRVLTAGTNIVLAKGTGVTGFNDLDASGVRSAVGLAAADLDTQLAAIPTDLLDLADGIESGVTLRQALRAISATCVAIISGAGTGTEVFKGIGQASGGTTRVTVTVDSSGNRSAVTLNL